MVTERLVALLDRKTLGMIYASQWTIGSDPPWYRIDAPWSYVLGAEWWAEELDREAWLKDVKHRLGLVTVDEIGSHALSRRLEEAGRSPWLPYLIATS